MLVGVTQNPYFKAHATEWIINEFSILLDHIYAKYGQNGKHWEYLLASTWLCNGTKMVLKTCQQMLDEILSLLLLSNNHLWDKKYFKMKASEQHLPDSCL